VVTCCGCFGGLAAFVVVAEPVDDVARVVVPALVCGRVELAFAGLVVAVRRDDVDVLARGADVVDVATRGLVVWCVVG
jgi:hypothetical protein